MNRPASSASQVWATLPPKTVTSPIPVMTGIESLTS
jgi:hypothetical protein